MMEPWWKPPKHLLPRRPEPTEREERAAENTCRSSTSAEERGSFIVQRKVCMRLETEVDSAPRPVTWVIDVTGLSGRRRVGVPGSIHARGGRTTQHCSWCEPWRPFRAPTAAAKQRCALEPSSIANQLPIGLPSAKLRWQRMRTEGSGEKGACETRQ
jgi:hypothetical protein